MTRFSGKTALVTGGASGIGLAAVTRLYAEGATVVVADINQEDLDKTAAAFDADRVRGVQVDVASFDQVSAAVQLAVDAFGRLDILLNNAGAVVAPGTTTDLSAEQWRRMIEINLFGTFNGCKAAIPVMQRNGGGAIVNTASISGLAGESGVHAYNAAKGGVINYTRALAVDYARDGIRTNAFCPGPTLSPGLVEALRERPPAVRDIWNQFIPLGRMSTCEEQAAVALFLASDDASFVNGAIVAVDGGVTSQFPRPPRA